MAPGANWGSDSPCSNWLYPAQFQAPPVGSLEGNAQEPQGLGWGF